MRNEIESLLFIKGLVAEAQRRREGNPFKGKLGAEPEKKFS